MCSRGGLPRLIGMTFWSMTSALFLFRRRRNACPRLMRVIARFALHMQAGSAPLTATASGTRQKPACLLQSVLDLHGAAERMCPDGEKRQADLRKAVCD